MSQTYKLGDTTPSLKYTVVDENDDPLVLDNATVTFKLKDIYEDEELASGSANIVDPTEGIVEYQWAENDLSKLGVFRGEFHLDLDGKKRTAPKENYIFVNILESLR